MTKSGHSNNSLDVMMILQTICLCISFRKLMHLYQSCPSSVLVQISSRIWNFSSPDSNLDFVWTRSKPDSSLDWVWKSSNFSFKIEKLENWNRKFEKFEINHKIRKITKFEKLNLKFENSKNWKFLKSFIFSNFFPNFHFFQIFRFFEFNFQVFQIFNFKTEIWIFSRPSPDSNLVPDQNLDMKKSRLWT